MACDDVCADIVTDKTEMIIRTDIPCISSMETFSLKANQSLEHTETEMIHSNGTNCQATDIVVMNVTKASGTLAGLLAAALVIVTIGWIVSCAYWPRKVKQRLGVVSDCVL